MPLICQGGQGTICQSAVELLSFFSIHFCSALHTSLVLGYWAVSQLSRGVLPSLAIGNPFLRRRTLPSLSRSPTFSGLNVCIIPHLHLHCSRVSHMKLKQSSKFFGPPVAEQLAPGGLFCWPQMLCLGSACFGCESIMFVSSMKTSTYQRGTGCCDWLVLLLPREKAPAGHPEYSYSRTGHVGKTSGQKKFREANLLIDFNRGAEKSGYSTRCMKYWPARKQPMRMRRFRTWGRNIASGIQTLANHGFFPPGIIHRSLAQV